MTTEQFEILIFWVRLACIAIMVGYGALFFEKAYTVYRLKQASRFAEAGMFMVGGVQKAVSEIWEMFNPKPKPDEARDAALKAVEGFRAENEKLRELAKKMIVEDQARKEKAKAAAERGRATRAAKAARLAESFAEMAARQEEDRLRAAAAEDIVRQLEAVPTARAWE